MNAVFHVIFPKGQGRYQAALPRRNSQEGGGISLPDAGAQLFHDQFVAGHLHIPAHEEIGQPQHRIEPVDAKEQQGQRLYQVIHPADMGLFVAEDVLPFLLLQPQGQIDAGPEKAQHKGGGDAVAFPDVSLPEGGLPQPPGKAQVGEDAVQKEEQRPHLPDQAPYLQPKLHRIGAGVGGGGRRRQALVHRLVKNNKAAFNLRLRGVKDILGDGLGPGHQAENAGEGHRTDQPEQHHPPQGVGDFLRRFLEQQPPRHHQKSRPGRPQAHV